MFAVRVGEERRHLVRRRQDAERVEEHPADELVVGAEVGRLDAQFLQLREDVVVDEVVAPCEPLRVHRSVERHAEDRDRDLGLEHRPDGARAVATRLRLARRRDFQVRRVVRLELGQPGHIARRAVGERRGGAELHLLARLEHAEAGVSSSLLTSGRPCPARGSRP